MVGDSTTGIGDGEIDGLLEEDFTIPFGVLDMLGDGEFTILIFTETIRIDTTHIDTIPTDITIIGIQDLEEELPTTVSIEATTDTV